MSRHLGDIRSAGIFASGDTELFYSLLSLPIRRVRGKFSIAISTGLFVCLSALSGSPAYADTITITGTLTQVSKIGLLPASPILRASPVSEGDPYTLSLVFESSFSDPGDYLFNNASLQLTAGTGFQFESEFDSIALTITPSGQDDMFSMFGCSTSSSPCLDGHRLDLDFTLPAQMINGQTLQVGTIDELAQFDLLVKDAPPTDYIGTVESYTYSSAPEPASIALSLAGVLALLARLRR
jgi:hypothetical protein